MSMRIKFDAFDGRALFDGYGEISVKGPFDDGSMMRERLALCFFGVVMPAPKAAHARLVVNGELRGLYTLREVWDETSVAAAFLAAARSALPGAAARPRTIPTCMWAPIPPLYVPTAVGAAHQDAGAGGRRRPGAPAGAHRSGGVRDRRRRRRRDRLPRRRDHHHDHRRAGGQQRDRRPLPVLRSADGQVLRSARGIRTTPSARRARRPRS